MNPITTRRRARLTGMIAVQVAAAEPAGAARLEVTVLRLFPVREPVSGRSYVVLRVLLAGASFPVDKDDHVTHRCRSAGLPQDGKDVIRCGHEPQFPPLRLLLLYTETKNPGEAETASPKNQRLRGGPK